MNWKAFVACFLLPATVLAQTAPPVQDIPPGEDRVVPVREGEKAPFTGQLFDQPTALRWGNWLLQYKYRLEWDVQREQQVYRVETGYRDRLLEVEKQRAAKVEADLIERLQRSEEARLKAEEEARNPAWYNTRTFGMAVGVVSTVGIMALSIWALEARN